MTTFISNRFARVGLIVISALIFPHLAHARGGLTLGFEFGGAWVWGDRPVDLESLQVTCIPADKCGTVVNTDSGAGFAFGLNFGYNILGYAAIETYVFGHGNKNSGKGKWEGTGHTGGLRARFFPVNFVESLKDRPWDVSLYIGYGLVSYLGYHDYTGEGKGWSGTHLLWGLGGEYFVTPVLSLGLDLKFVRPNYNEFIFNWDDNITDKPAKTTTGFELAPMFTMTFHWLDPER